MADSAICGCRDEPRIVDWYYLGCFRITCMVVVFLAFFADNSNWFKAHGDSGTLGS